MSDTATLSAIAGLAETIRGQRVNSEIEEGVL